MHEHPPAQRHYVLLPWWEFFGRRVAVHHLHDLRDAMLGYVFAGEVVPIMDMEAMGALADFDCLR